MVKFEDCPNDRYALPSDNKIKHAFFIRASNKDVVQKEVYNRLLESAAVEKKHFLKTEQVPELFLILKNMEKHLTLPLNFQSI